MLDKYIMSGDCRLSERATTNSDLRWLTCRRRLFLNDSFNNNNKINI